MKKIVLVLVFSMFLSSACFALTGLSLGALAGSYNYNGTSNLGYGLEVGIPMISLIPLTDTKIEVLSITMGNFTALPITLKSAFKFPLLPVYAGMEVGYLVLNSNQANLSIPGGLIYGVFAGYEQSAGPLVSLFAQVGYENLKIDYTNPALNLRYTFDASGVTLKGGARIGL